MTRIIYRDPDTIITDLAEIVETFNQSCENSSDIYDYDASMKVIISSTELNVAAEFAITEIWSDDSKYDFLEALNCEATLKYAGNKFLIDNRTYKTYSEWHKELQERLRYLLDAPRRFDADYEARIAHEDLQFRAIYEG
jgi:hypothetical protein